MSAVPFELRWRDRRGSFRVPGEVFRPGPYDATVLSERAVQKVRGRACGWEYAAALLARFGAGPLTEGEDGGAWLARWLPRLTRPLRHPSNHRYAWSLGGTRLTSTAPYPKKGLF
ncbi:MAG TPA: hypothetical protein VFW33_14980 [Gemmataceae bacterium]|nr:hypothetical protein [Gemmataceae bacterium]